MKIQLSESDYAPLETFALGSRMATPSQDDVAIWLRASRLLLEGRAPVRPLVRRKAAELREVADSLCGALGYAGSHSVSFRSDDHPVLVSGRLCGLPPTEDCPIVVSWNPATAIATDWGLFTARWEQICHPAADSVTVMPLAGGWNLCYRRYEVFQFLSWPRAM